MKWAQLIGSWLDFTGNQSVDLWEHFSQVSGHIRWSNVSQSKTDTWILSAVKLSSSGISISIHRNVKSFITVRISTINRLKPIKRSNDPERLSVTLIIVIFFQICGRQLGDVMKSVREELLHLLVVSETLGSRSGLRRVRTCLLMWSVWQLYDEEISRRGLWSSWAGDLSIGQTDTDSDICILQYVDLLGCDHPPKY